MSAFFVTATGTEIGKTFVTAALVRHLRKAGGAVEAIKPVITGFDPATMAESDPAVLLAALGRDATPGAIERMAPYRFAPALSPDMAARLEHRALDYDALAEFCRRAIAAHTGTLLIEGIGGVMVPLDGRRTVLDLIATLKIPALLIAGSYLGSLSHTLTSIEVLEQRNIPIVALVVNESPGSTVPLAETVKTLTDYVQAIPVIALRRDDRGEAAIAEIAALL
jgi:dethiobiotin synthetase